MKLGYSEDACDDRPYECFLVTPPPSILSLGRSDSTDSCDENTTPHKGTSELVFANYTVHFSVHSLWVVFPWLVALPIIVIFIINSLEFWLIISMMMPSMSSQLATMVSMMVISFFLIMMRWFHWSKWSLDKQIFLIFIERWIIFFIFRKRWRTIAIWIVSMMWMSMMMFVMIFFDHLVHLHPIEGENHDCKREEHTQTCKCSHAP